jgi:recombination protein RecA
MRGDEARERPLMGDEKVRAIDSAIAQIEKRFGKGSILKMDSTSLPEVSVISTGSIALDLALGVGGLPRGRVVEIFGPEASGKTTLAQHIIAEAQKLGGATALIDAEHAFDPAYAAKCGVNIDELLISQPGMGEEALEIAEVLVRSDAVDVVAVDSVAALVPRAEIEGDMGDSHMGLQARLMSQALRKLTSSINKSRCVVLFINQLREKIGVMFGNPETTPGGRALKFYSSVRLDIRRVGQIKRGSDIIGNKTRVRVVKNKVAPPFKVCEFDLMYSGGISHEGGLIDLGLEHGILTKSGAHLSYSETRLGLGREAAREFLGQNRDVADQLEAEIRQAAAENGLLAASAGGGGKG